MNRRAILSFREKSSIRDSAEERHRGKRWCRNDGEASVFRGERQAPSEGERNRHCLNQEEVRIVFGGILRWVGGFSAFTCGRFDLGLTRGVTILLN